MMQCRSRIALVIVTASALAIANVCGCGHEERGPTLSGGREVKSWIADLQSPSPRTRREAVLKLGNAGDADPAVAQALAAALNDTDALVRRDAIRAVVKLKDPGESIKEQLEAMSRNDKDAPTRDLAGKAVARLGAGEH